MDWADNTHFVDLFIQVVEGKKKQTWIEKDKHELKQQAWIENEHE